MEDKTQSAIKLLEALTERAKELTCLYTIEELLKKPNMDLDHICNGIIKAIPPGWQYPEICQAKIVLDGKTYQSPDLDETEWTQCADIIVQERKVGQISVYYSKNKPNLDIGPFLDEEKKLIETIADRLGHFYLYKKMEHLVQKWQTASEDLSQNRRKDWEAVLDLLRQTDSSLFLSISNKMLNHLSWSGIKEAEKLRLSITPVLKNGIDAFDEATGRQHPSRVLNFSTELIENIFRLASEHLGGDEILSRIQMWIHEDRLSSLVQIVQRHLPLSDVTDALRRHYYTDPDETEEKYPVSRGLKVSLIRRVLSDQFNYVNLAKQHVDIEDLYHLLQKVVFPPESHGNLGTKSAEFFLSSQILRKAGADSEILSNLRIPRTWYVSSDMMLHFMHYNNIDQIIEQKYKEIDRVRLEYSHIVQTFTNSVAPPEMVKGLSIALDDFGEKPLIVRSSNILDEHIGPSFFKKCRSVFVANQGTKQERLAGLVEAVAKVYASAFSPDLIEHRVSRGILDSSDEMGILIQEAVGTSVGHYFLPSYAGIASSNNDFRWAAEIRREDGLVRIVPGFCNPAFARNTDDFPVLFAPGQPSQKVHLTQDETIKYAPKMIDVINLETKAYETINIRDLLRDFGKEYPNLEQVVSVHRNGIIHPIEESDIDFNQDEFLVTFEGLISRSRFIVKIRSIMNILEEKLNSPVEIRFASDGNNLYLLQCCTPNLAAEKSPSPIPKDVPEDRVIFSAKRYISNGKTPDITHIVYVDPSGYDSLQQVSDRRAVGEAIGKLNKLLPKRQFIIMGPGQWCLRDKSRLCDGISYPDIDNTALLMGIFHQTDGIAPDISFGIPFFQELFESDIRYLPLYPDEEGINFNRLFLKGARNVLSDLLPEHSSLSEVLRVIDIPESKEGLVLQVLMNAELDEALAVLTEHDAGNTYPERGEQFQDEHSENYWRWRYGMAEQMASELDFDRFGISGFYLFGSTKNGTAGPGSDIDILVHFRGDKAQRDHLDLWFEGWSLCLDEMNYLKTGYRSKGLLDVHIVTDEDIAQKTSYAVKIGAITDAARPLKTKSTATQGR